MKQTLLFSLFLLMLLFYFYYSEHKEDILNKSSNMTSKTESDTLLSMIKDKMISPFVPCHGEGQSVWESSKPLNDSKESLFQDLAASKFIRDCTQNASTNWGVDSETAEADSTKASVRSKSTPRPYPVHVNSKTLFQMCKHYVSGMRCKESCTFAHGEEELSQWTMQRNIGEQYLTVLQAVLRHIQLLRMNVVGFSQAS